MRTDTKKKMKLIICFVGFALFFEGEAGYAGMPKGKYLEGKGSKVAVILAHGRGQSPNGNVVGSLRRAIHKELGFHTLSLQMPDTSNGLLRSQEVAAAFPKAYQRIQAAIDFLKKEKGADRIYLMGHGMGGRMTSAFIVNYPDAGVVGFIGVGLLGGRKEPLNANLNLRKVKIPVIDIYAENDGDAKAAALREPLVSEQFVQVPISGAKHNYRGYEKQIADAVIGWLKKQEGK